MWILPKPPARSASKAKRSRNRPRSKTRFARAKTATVEGRPYLLDIHIKREGIGAVSEWHPAYSLADQRTRKV